MVEISAVEPTLASRPAIIGADGPELTQVCRGEGVGGRVTPHVSEGVTSSSSMCNSEDASCTTAQNINHKQLMLCM